MLGPDSRGGLGLRLGRARLVVPIGQALRVWRKEQKLLSVRVVVDVKQPCWTLGSDMQI